MSSEQTRLQAYGRFMQAQLRKTAAMKACDEADAELLAATNEYLNARRAYWNARAREADGFAADNESAFLASDFPREGLGN